MDAGSEIYAVRTALSGSEEMGPLCLELLAGCARLFMAALALHSLLPPGALYQRCVALLLVEGSAASKRRQRHSQPSFGAA